MEVGKVLNRSWHIIATHPGPVFGYGFVALLIAAITFGILLGPMYTGFARLCSSSSAARAQGLKSCSATSDCSIGLGEFFMGWLWWHLF